MSMTRKRTEKANAQPGQIWPYLRYTTLSDVFHAITASLILFAVVGVCAAGAYWIVEKLAAGEGASVENDIPHWLSYAAIAAVFLWALRGQTIRIPRWTFGAWICASLFAAAVSYIVTSCSGAVQVLLLLGAGLLVSMIDTLNDRGMVNAETAAAGGAAANAP